MIKTGSHLLGERLGPVVTYLTRGVQTHRRFEVPNGMFWPAMWIQRNARICAARQGTRVVFCHKGSGSKSKVLPQVISIHSMFYTIIACLEVSNISTEVWRWHCSTSQAAALCLSSWCTLGADVFEGDHFLLFWGNGNGHTKATFFKARLSQESRDFTGLTQSYLIFCTACMADYVRTIGQDFHECHAQHSSSAPLRCAAQRPGSTPHGCFHLCPHGRPCGDITFRLQSVQVLWSNSITPSPSVFQQGRSE